MRKEPFFVSESLPVETAIERGRRLPCVFLRTYSAASLGPVPETLPEAEEILEARFFSRSEEIRIFRDGGALRSVSLREAPDAHVMESVYEIDNQALGRRLTVRETFGFDEDGQAYIALSRLADWEGGTQNGK